MGVYPEPLQGQNGNSRFNFAMRKGVESMRSFAYESFTRTYGTPEEKSKPRLYLPDGSVHYLIPESSATQLSGPSSSLPTREVDFEQLPDGRLAELVEDPHDPKETLLAVGGDGSYELVQSIPCDKEILVPLVRKEELLRFVTLPRGLKEVRGRARVAAADDLDIFVFEFIKQHVALDYANLCVLALFVLSTWFVDRFEVAPYLLIVGPPQSGKTTLLNVLALLCRRSWLVGDVSAAALYRTCAKIHPTLLLDESMTQAGLSDPALRHFLRVGTTRQGVARRGEVFDCYGAKVFAALEPPSDAALASRCLIVPMLVANPEKKDLAQPAAREYAERVQQGLLQWRFDRWASIQPARVPGSEALRPRAQDLLACLAAAAPAQEWRNFLLAFFKSTATDVEEDERTILSRLLNSVLHKVIHGQSELGVNDPRVRSWIMVKRLTDAVNLELGLRGERIQLSPEKVGHILTALGLTNRDRTNCGMRLWMDLAAGRRIHQNAKTYGLESLGGNYEPQMEDCPLCKEDNLEKLLAKLQPSPESESQESGDSAQQTSAEGVPKTD